MKVGSLFSGIGGFDLGLERAGFEIAWQVEIDPFCQKVLEKHWPDVPRYGDIRELRGDELGAVDLICGGFPCQPFSIAGERKGKKDDRDLWPEMFRIIQEIRPRWVLGENVANFVNMELERTILDLESEGYETQTFIIPACAVGAPHRRDRVWIVAHADSVRLPGGAQTSPNKATNKQLARLLQTNFWAEIPRPRTNRVGHGLPYRVDRVRALGNAVVPQIVEVIGRAIFEMGVAQ